MPTSQQHQQFFIELSQSHGHEMPSNVSATRNYPEMMDDLIKSLADANSERLLGQISQVALVTAAMRSGMAPSESKAALLRIVSADVEYESSANLRIKEWLKMTHPNFDGIDKQKMTVRYLFKHLGSPVVAAMTGALLLPRAFDMLMLTRLQTGGWSDFIDMYQVMPDTLVASLNKYCPAQNSAMCAWWPEGPFAHGDIDRITSSTTPAATTQTTNKGVTTMATPARTSALASLNAAFKPIIDNMFSQSGLQLSVDQLISELARITEAEDERDMYKFDAAKAEDEVDALRSQLAQAKSAMPTTLAIASTNTTIPNGKMVTKQVGDVFPMLKGVTLDVPAFEWDHAHPDVPAVNDGYIFRKEMLIKSLRCLKNNENFWLQGHTGSGKTTFIEQIAARLGWPVARIAFDSNIDRTELVGRMSLKGDGKGGTVSEWLPGVLEKASSMGYILLVDEVDAGHPNSLYTLQPLLEGKALNLLEDGGRIVPISPLFRMVATGNTCGNGDPSGLYPACRILSAATLDRFATFIHVPYMTLDEEKNLINTMVPGLKAAIVEKMAKFGMEMRKAFTTNQTPISYSPRRSIAFAREVMELQSMGFKDESQVLTAAFRSKLYDAASEEFRQRLTEIANASFGGIDPTKSLA